MADCDENFDAYIWYVDSGASTHMIENKKWFEDNIGQLEKVWSIIEEERVTGYQHRAPNKRVPKSSGNSAPNEGGGCLLNVIKLN